MPYFFYVILRIYAALGIFKYPLILLQLAVMTRTIMLIRKRRLRKAENNADKKEASLLVCYLILTAFLWLPIIVLAIMTAINVKTR